MQEGFIPFKGYKTYYKVFGKCDRGKYPILILHGGPGAPHNYLLNLRKLSDGGRQVIFYDQLGGGRSSNVEDDSLWNAETFIEEIDAVRDALKLSDIHLLGHSWGGMLAIDYLLTNPSGVHSVILSSTIVSIPLYQSEADRLIGELPKNVRKIIKKHEKDGTIEAAEYKEAYKAYDKRHTFRGKHWPKELSTPPGGYNYDIYHRMWGLSESNTSSGTLKNWDRISKLHNIKIPALITSGKYDEVTPRQAQVTQAEIPNAKQVLFNASAHLHTYEEEPKYLRTVSEFLDAAET